MSESLRQPNNHADDLFVGGLREGYRLPEGGGAAYIDAKGRAFGLEVPAQPVEAQPGEGYISSGLHEAIQQANQDAAAVEAPTGMNQTMLIGGGAIQAAVRAQLAQAEGMSAGAPQAASSGAEGTAGASQGTPGPQ